VPGVALPAAEWEPAPAAEREPAPAAEREPAPAAEREARPAAVPGPDAEREAGPTAERAPAPAAVPAPERAVAPAVPGPATMAPTPDVEAVFGDSTLPGGHRGGFQRLPTAPIEVSVPGPPGGEQTEPLVLWAMPEPPAPYRGLAAWALAFSIAGLIVAIFVGWGFPLGIVGIVSAILALRRPLESRAVAWWALVLGCVSLLYSAGWLALSAARANLFG
jgi:hypothetical protein